MKAFARIDVTLQVILIIGGFAMGLSFLTDSMNGDYMFIPYFIVGGWQIFSVIVHFAGEGFRFNKLRKIYLISLLIVIIVLVASTPSGAILFSLMGLLFLSPLMAIFYCYLCYRELQNYKQGLPGYDLSASAPLDTPVANASGNNAEQPD